MTDTKQFPLVTGNPSLDLVNTELVRRGIRHDLLVSENDLLDWLKFMEKRTPFWDESLFPRAKAKMDQIYPAILEFRNVLRNQFEFIADTKVISDDFIKLLEIKIEKAPFTYRLVNKNLIPKPIGEIEVVLLSLIAYDTLTLIETKKLHFLKRCTNPDCVLLFIDESGRRKWCSMKICGNRQKVSRFQSRESGNS